MTDLDPERYPAQPGGVEHVQALLDAEHERGYAGATVDATPRENYTIAGVTAGKPVPPVHGGR